MKHYCTMLPSPPPSFPMKNMDAALRSLCYWRRGTRPFCPSILEEIYSAFLPSRPYCTPESAFPNKQPASTRNKITTIFILHHHIDSH
jgi:hypothetical protein